MIRIFLGLFLILLLHSGCEKSEILQLDLKGTLKGEVLTLNEFGYPNYDNGNITIHLEGSEPSLSVITDSVGKYELNNVPIGTYNLIISKEGYGEHQRQGFQIVGGNEPLYFNGSIIEKSSTTIESLSLENKHNELFLKGIVNHNYINDGWGFRTVAIRYFVHSLDNPSDTNFLQTGIINFSGESGSRLEVPIYLDKNQFSSGSNIYVIAYGCYNYENAYYDILSSEYRYTSLGIGSNIASIIIP